MNSFYGNLKNNSRASFIFDKVYPNRKAMEDAKESDGVWVNRYVLIAYNYSITDDIPPVVTDTSQWGFGSYDTNNDNYYRLENKEFKQNRTIDMTYYNSQYDKTVWMKIYSNNEEKYIQVGSLNAAAPAFDLLIDAPGEENGKPHFDYYHSGELNYNYHVPKNWNIIMNHYNGVKKNITFTKVTDLTQETYKANQYYYYQTSDPNAINGYVLDTNNTLDKEKQYYIKVPKYQKVTFYKPNTFYYIDNDQYILDDSNNMTENRIYYIIDSEVWDTYTNITEEFFIENKDELYVIDVVTHNYTPAEEYISDNVYYKKISTEYKEITLTTYESNTYYIFNLNTHKFQIDTNNSPSTGNEYYKIYDYYFTPINLLESAYSPSTYYYLDTNGYILDSGDFDSTKEYFIPSIYNFNDSAYYYYNDLIGQQSNKQYPYVNGEGFSSLSRNYDYTTQDDILLKEVPSGELYPDHHFLMVHLTTDTYIKNLYYHKKGDTFEIATEDEYLSYDNNPENLYYTKTTGHFIEVSFDENETGEIYQQNKYYIKDPNTKLYVLDSDVQPKNVTHYKFINIDSKSVQNDTKRLDFELPSVGNAISDVYDTIYGRPLNPNYPTGIKYIYKLGPMMDSYPYQKFWDEEHTNCCSIDGVYYFLSDNEWETEDPLFNFYDENDHPVPVYNLANNADRPYTQQQLFNFLNIEPYNNITPNDPVSVTWGVEELKKYISELRYLSHGEIDGDYDPLAYNGNGLQADWSIDDASAFGYISNKPTIISHYKQITEPRPINDLEKYYYIRDVDDDKHIPYFIEGQFSGTGINNHPSFRYEMYDPNNPNVIIDDGFINLTRRENVFGGENNNQDLANNFIQDIYEIADVTSHYNFQQLPDKYILLNSDIAYYQAISEEKNIYRFINAKYELITEYQYKETADYTSGKVFYLENDKYKLDTVGSITENRIYYTVQPAFRSEYFYTEDTNEVIINNNVIKFQGETYFIQDIDQESFIPNTYYVHTDEPNAYILAQEYMPFYTDYYKKYYRYNTQATPPQNSQTNNITTLSLNSLYLGFNGKIINYFITKEKLPNDNDNWVDFLNQPGNYDRYIYKIIFAKDENIEGILDENVIRDGKFHIYTNIRKYDTGLAIERIWQRIPVEDIMVAATTYDPTDVSDIIGEHRIQIKESVEVLDSPMSQLSNSVIALSNKTATIERIVGTTNYPNAADSITTRVTNIENSITAINITTNSHTNEIDNLKNFVGQNSLNSNTSTLGYRMLAIENSVTANTSEISNNTTRIENLENFVGQNNLDSDTSTLGYRMLTIENSVTANASEISNNTIRIQSLEEFVGNQNTSSTTSLAYDMTQAKNNINDLTERIDDIELSIDEINETINESNSNPEPDPNNGD